MPAELTWFFADTEAHYDATGAPTKAYSHVALGTPAARVERTSNTTTKVEFVFHALAGSTLASVQDDGTTNAVFTYSPLGEVVETTSANAQTRRRRFNDKYNDVLTGLNYYGRRYLDPVSGSWTQSDPLYRFSPDAAWTAPRRAHLYAFSLNNALRFVDPDGSNGEDTLGDPRQLIIDIGTAVFGGAAVVKSAAASGVARLAASAPPIAVGVAVTVAFVGEFFKAKDGVSRFARVTNGAHQVCVAKAGSLAGGTTVAILAGKLADVAARPVPINAKKTGEVEALPAPEGTPDDSPREDQLPHEPQGGEGRKPQPLPDGRIPKKGFLEWLKDGFRKTPKYSVVPLGKSLDRSPAPADADGNGQVTSQEESQWSAAQN